RFNLNGGVPFARKCTDEILSKPRSVSQPRIQQQEREAIARSSLVIVSKESCRHDVIVMRSSQPFQVIEARQAAVEILDLAHSVVQCCKCRMPGSLKEAGLGTVVRRLHGSPVRFENVHCVIDLIVSLHASKVPAVVANE